MRQDLKVKTNVVARPIDAAATEEADIMGAERVELLKQRVSRRSVVGTGVKLAYVSPLVVVSFTLSPPFGYMPAAAYFEKPRQAKKPSPQPGSRARPNRNSGAKPTPDPTGEPCADPTIAAAAPGAGGGDGAAAGRNAGSNKKDNGNKNGRGNGNKGDSRSHRAHGAECGDPQGGGSEGNGGLHKKGNSGGETKPGGQNGHRGHGAKRGGSPPVAAPDAGGAPTVSPPGEGAGPRSGGASRGGGDRVPPRAGPPKLPPVGSDGHVPDELTPTDAAGNEAGDTGGDPNVSVAKVAVCHAVCTKKDPHRPVAYRLIELADNPEAWRQHVSQDHGQGTCSKDEDVILGPANSEFTVKDCPGNRISGP